MKLFEFLRGNEEAFISQLKRHEGVSKTVYQCSMNKLTIGFGRNLEDKGISDVEAEMLLKNDLEDIRVMLHSKVKVYSSWRLSTVRRAVLENMAFNLGVTGLLKFKKMIAALEARDYDRAAIEMLDSNWAKQVGNRAIELSAQMRTGKWQ